MAIDREKIIEHIEAVFLYLGCANIDTSSMDGAIPIDALAVSDETQAIGILDTNPMVSGLTTGWCVRTVHFNGESLELMTCSDFHWSNLTHIYASAVSNLRIAGEKARHPEYDCYNKLFYSRINKFGTFEKFEIDQPRVFSSGIAAKRIYNPYSLFAFKGEYCRILKNESETIAKSIRATQANIMLAGLAVGMKGNWSAKVKVSDNIPSLTVLTDPTGVKELWKLRDIPDGKKRRDALLHWVSQHWRQNRKDPEVESYVRKHLRGATEFRHGEMSVVVQPSEKDNVEIEFAKRDREMLRNKKEDLRKRQTQLRKKLAHKS